MPKTLNECKVYTIHGIEMIHIAEFAEITGRSVRSTRHLIEDGNKVRKMKFFRDRSRLMIPVAEVFGYPLTDAGHSMPQKNIYHYVRNAEGILHRELCADCTFGKGCPERQIADALVVPEGDK